MIYVTGDTHRNNDIAKLSVHRFPEQEKMTKDDHLIIAGDFGGLWYGKARDEEFLRTFEERSFTTLWVDGNHENFDELETYPVSEWHGGKVHKINGSLYHLMRGQIYEIEGSTIFTMGGGTSIDRAWRTAHVSWWPQELHSYKEQEEALENLEKVGNKVDYVITHAAPRSVAKKFTEGNGFNLDVDCPVERFLDELMEIINYKAWYCGHYHVDTFDRERNIRTLYNDVVKLG